MKIVFILLSIVCLFSCNYNRTKAASEQSARELTAEQLDFASQVNYKSVNAQIIAPQCLNCHSNATGNKGGLNLETLDAIKAKMNQVYYRTIETKDMPPERPLSEGALELLKSWIEAGAPENNVGKPGAPEIRGPYTWMKIRDQILNSNCLDCHSGPDAEGKLDLASYDTFKNQWSQIFDRTFVKQDMPPQPYPSLSPNEKFALLKWISQGMPQ